MKIKLRKPQKPTRRQVTKFLLYAVIIVLGNMLAAGASAFFIIPNNLSMGGTTGLGIFVRNLIPDAVAWKEWASSITVYVCNIALFILGTVLLGKTFAASVLAGTVLYPTFLAVFNLAEAALESSLGGALCSDNLLLAAILGGMVFGLGVGIVVRVGASTGGTDIPPLIFQKYFNWPVSVSLWVIDMAIVAMQMIVIRPFENALYGVIIVLLSSMVVEKVAPIGMKRTQVKIISTKYQEIRDMILTKVHRGVTVLYGQTGYLKEDCYMLLTIVSHRELVTLKAEVQRIDPEAFLTISTVSEVRGRGFHSDGVDFLMPQDRANPHLPPTPPPPVSQPPASPAPQPSAPAPQPSVSPAEETKKNPQEQ